MTQIINGLMVSTDTSQKKIYKESISTLKDFQPKVIRKYISKQGDTTKAHYKG